MVAEARVTSAMEGAMIGGINRAKLPMLSLGGRLAVLGRWYLHYDPDLLKIAEDLLG